MEGEASLQKKVTCIFSSFFNESLAFLGLCHSAVGSGLGGAGFNGCKGILVSGLVGQGCRTRSLVLTEEGNAAPGKQGGISAVFCHFSMKT